MEKEDKVVEVILSEINELKSNPFVKRYLTLTNILSSFSGISDSIFIENNTTTSSNIKSNQKNEGEKSYKKQVALIFKEQSRFLHIREIVEIAKNKKLEIDDKSIKQAVYALKLDGVIVSVSINNSYKNTYWGSKNWVDENNNIKPEYDYNKNISFNQKEDIEI